jgi:hypothetical protein
MEGPPRPRRIFICYRREDTSGYAGRLYDRLRSRFGEHDVFMDIDDIDPGADYGEIIDRVSRSIDFLVVLIGPHWLLARDQAGNRRLDEPDDFVRLEISAALERGVLVIPVLVQGAVMPSAAELPMPLARLARRNAIELSDARWDYDADRLIRALESDLPEVEAKEGSVPSPSPTADTGRHRATLFGALPMVPASMALAGLVAVLVWNVLVGRSWHSELAGIRLGAGLLLVVLAGLGLWRRQWVLVVAGGILGLVGFSLWMLQLLATGHDVEDLLSPGTDGIPNALVGIGMLLVIAAGVVGIKKDYAQG